MKKLILLLTLFTLYCTTETPIELSANFPDPTTPIPEPVTPPADPTIQPYTLSVKSGGVVYFYDGSQFVTTSYEHRYGLGKYTALDTLYILDTYGQETNRILLINKPDAINTNWQSVTYTGAYSEFYCDNTLYSAWTNNFYVTEKIIITANGNVYAKDTAGVLHAVNTANINVRVAYDGGIDIYNFDAGTRTAMISGRPVSWATNYFTSAKHWLNINGVWYSNNGYKWDGTTLTENGSSMSAWNAYPFPAQDIYGENPVVISAGVFNGHSYWIECNTGFLVRHDPATDRTDALYRIYQGDGTRNTGSQKSNILKPKIIDGVLYFSDGGQIWKADILTGSVVSFFGGVGEVWRY